MILGVDGISDFEDLYSRKHDEEVQFDASTCWLAMATTSGSCRCDAEDNLAHCSCAARTASSSPRSSKARLGRIYSAMPASWGWKGLSRNIASGPIAPAVAALGEGQKPDTLR